MATQFEGFIEFGANADWWQEGRVAVALRQAPKPRVQVPTNAELERALTKVIEGGNLSPSAVLLARKMRGDFIQQEAKDGIS